MAVPKRKTSKARRGWRCTHQVEKVKSITHCLNCKEPLATHQVCGSCGYYKGIKVLATKAERAVRRDDLRRAKADREGVTQNAVAPEQILEAQAEAAAAVEEPKVEPKKDSKK